MVYISNTIFSDNSTTGDGGAIYNEKRESLEMYFPGGIFSESDTTTTLKDTVRFINNSADGNGGAIFVDTNAALTTSAGTVFAGNKASLGGAIYCAADIYCNGSSYKNLLPVTIDSSRFETFSDSIYTAGGIKFTGINYINANVTVTGNGRFGVDTGAGFVFHDYSGWDYYTDEDKKFWTKGAITVDGSLASASVLIFSGTQGVTFSGNSNVISENTVIVIDTEYLKGWFTNPFEDKITLATGADFTNAQFSIDKDSWIDNSGMRGDVLEDASAGAYSFCWEGVTYTINNGTNALTISRTEPTPVDITAALNEIISSTSSNEQEKTRQVSEKTLTTANDGTVAVIGSATDPLRANSTVLYMNGLAANIGSIQDGRRLYGGGVNAIKQGNVTLNGTLRISGTDIVLDYIYGGGFLTSCIDAPDAASKFNSWVKIEANASFDSSRTVSLLGGSHINQYRIISNDGSVQTSPTTITANSELIIDANVINAGFVCGGHGCYTTAEIKGDSSLSISAGTYGAEDDEIVMVAGGSVLYINTKVPSAKLTQDGNTALTISGGSFNSNVYGGNIFLYEGEDALEKNNGAGGTVTLTGTSSVTIDCSAGNAIKFNKNIFAGSNGENTVSSTKVLFKGSGNASKNDGAYLSITGYVSGDSSGRYGDMEVEGSYKQFAGVGNREICFQNFHGTLGGATALYDFDEFTFENSVIDLGNAALNSAGETWNFSNGSRVKWDTELNFAGDTMILGKDGDSLTESEWIVFSGLDNDTLADLYSVEIFGLSTRETEVDGKSVWTTAPESASTTTGYHQLEVNGSEGNYSLVVKLA